MLQYKAGRLHRVQHEADDHQPDEDNDDEDDGEWAASAPQATLCVNVSRPVRAEQLPLPPQSSQLTRQPGSPPLQSVRDISTPATPQQHRRRGRRGIGRVG